MGLAAVMIFALFAFIAIVFVFMAFAEYLYEEVGAWAWAVLMITIFFIAFTAMFHYYGPLF